MDAANVKNLLGAQQGSAGSSDIPIEHMDYDYIGKCEKIKELEKILKVLRSGKEGHYPDLIKFCEDRIGDLDPNSRSLIKDKGPASKYDLDSEEWAKVNTDIKDWTSDISQSNDAISKGQGDQKLPPVRKGATIDTHGKKQNEDSDQAWGKPSKDRIKSHDYRKWDKYDAETEAKKIEGADDKGQRLRDAASELSASRSAHNTPETINVEGMSDREREVIANREKDKGNEAFRSSDFDEAVTYYSRSISVIPSAPAYNNRALARIKLGNFKDASNDCTKVLELEPDNIKAFLRRGTARKSLNEFALARQDLDRVLTMEPHNKQAKDLLADLDAKEAKAKKKQENLEKAASTSKPGQNSASPSSPTKGGRRLIIEEVEGSESEEEQWEDAHEEVVKETKSKQNGEDRGSKLVNGVGTTEPKVEHILPTNSAQESQVPQTKNEPEIIRNIPYEEESKPCVNEEEKTKPCVNGESDEVDGGCVSRPVQGDDTEKDTQQNRLNSEKESQENQKQGHQSESPSVNGVPPPAPRVDRPLPAAVVSMKDKALELYKAGQYGEARDKFTQAINKILPDKEDFGSALASLYSNRAACSTRIGDIKACIEDCGACLEMNPYNARVLVRRGAAYESKEKYRHAYVDFQQALSMDPLNKVAQEATSRLVRLLREEDGSSWRDKLPTRPDMPSMPKRPPILTTMAPSNATTPVTVNTSTTKATMTSMTLGQESEVKSKVKAEVKTEVKPEVKPEHNKETEKKKVEPTLTKEERFQKLKDEGNAFFKKGTYNDAVRCYSSCIDTDPTQVASYTNRALCYLKLNQFHKAETDCSIALALEENNIKALYRRAQASKGLKEYKKCLQDLMSLLKVDAQNKEAKKEMDAVKDLWRKELMAAKGESAKSAKKSKAEKKPTRIQIEESDTDSNEEKEDSSQVRPNQKSSSKAGKSSSKGDSKSTAKESQEIPADKQTKQTSSKKAARNSKPTTNAAPKLNKVTAYEFMQAWMSLKGTRNLAGYADLLKQVPPNDLPKVLSNKLDGDMLGLIVRATSEHLAEKDPGMSYSILYHLIDVERFNTMVLFLSKKDKKSLRKALDNLELAKCEAYTTEDVKTLRQNYAL
ncbi:sperm-associated antigen 1-like isoform X2 [Amphiura filiformis]|uniref:sperm-associated antigen 1-like isoform X2 n=1 Tax=Amphiura filiformis TaxID=82378 RepID=UPI003B222AAE